MPMNSVIHWLEGITNSIYITTSELLYSYIPTCF